jgi:hypothetical protein
LVVALACFAACSNPRSETDSSAAANRSARPTSISSTTPSPTATTAPTPPAASPLGPLLEPDERDRILEAYRRFWPLAADASRRPPSSWRQTLAAVVTEPLLSELLDGLAEQRRHGLVDYGTVVLHPRIVQYDAGRASIVDCQDASQSGTLDVDTGVAKTVGSAHTAITVVLARGSDRRWRLSAARQLDTAC